MKFELDLMRPNTPTYDAITPAVRVHCRKIVNTSLNALVHDGLLVNSFAALAECMIVAMAGVTQTLITLNLDPQVEDFIHAAAELASIIRHDLDNALKVDNMDDVRVCCVMVEILAKGISACLGMPYEELFTAAANGQKDFSEILTRSGHIKPASEA